VSFGRRPLASTILGAIFAFGAVFAAIVALLGATPAAASSNQRAIFEDDTLLLENPNPGKTLDTLRQLGVSTVRVSLRWLTIAPRSQPRNPADPASYPARSWGPYDSVVKGAASRGIEVDLMVTGGAPRWATTRRTNYGQWRPSARQYGLFVRAVATHYDGHHGVPGVHFWELWDEPNWGQMLAPQANGSSTSPVSPGLYRPMLDAGWSALARTGHGHDTILMGSLSPRGETTPGPYLTTKPLKFMRALYCVGDDFRPLRGGAAAQIGCPTNARGSRGFRSAHPALFGASGVNAHPYPFHLPPTQADSDDPDYVEFNELPRLESMVSRLQRVYGSHAVLPVYNTEYAYETNPPNRSDHFVSPGTAGYYINWAEYLSWKRPWITSYSQFLLRDPPPGQGASLFGRGGFAAGLVFAGGAQKADYFAYRMPIFLPRTQTKPGRRLEVWGCVRPAHFAQLDSGKTQSVQIQLNGRTVLTVPIRNLRGYFDVYVRFPGSGAVTLRWAYPDRTVIHSRAVGIGIR
jgi:hypothetical protein